MKSVTEDGNDLIPLAVQLLLKQCSQDADAIIDKFTNQLAAEIPPKLIYHYTNAVGLKGILETGDVWLSDIFSLNDPSEITHGFSIATDVVNKQCAKGPLISQKFAEQFSKFQTDFGIERTAHYFVSSFSSDSADLDQWRSYADGGRGFALGFDTKELETAFSDHGKALKIPISETFRVTYDDKLLREILTDIVRKFVPLISAPFIRDLSEDGFVEYMHQLTMMLTVQMLRVPLFFKHNAYFKEKEYRFQQVFSSNYPVSDVKYKVKGYTLSRYREFNWKKLAPASLQEIIIGPADKQKAGAFLDQCIATFHPINLRVIVSDIPYRG